jgi:hypothetical protein
MSGDRDPIRLLDSESGASPLLREVLGSTRDDGPAEADLLRLGARVAALGEPTSTGAGGGAGGAPILAVALIVAGLATLVGGLVFWSRPTAPRAPRPPSAPSVGADPPPTVEPAPAPAVSEPPPSLPPSELPLPRGAAPHESSSHESHTSHRRRPGPAPAATEAAASTEIDLLGAAQRALRSGVPRRALELAEEHAVRFPAGVLVEEREAIAVEALARLGRRDEAAVRHASFVRRFPHSTYRARLEKLVPR